MPLYYMLDVWGEPIATDDVLAWGRWYERADRRIAVTKVGAAQVSTVFLGMDHNFFDGPFPVLWETLVFGGPLDGKEQRYTSRAAAVEGHALIVARCRSSARRVRRSE